MKLYFCYEKTMTGNWQPVVYNNDKPLMKSSNGQVPDRSTLYIVPSDCIVNDEPLFGKLIEMFPPPVLVP
jgi:hypothetical protein